MEDKKIEVVKNWSELKSVQDIQAFIRFANFYRQFIRGFSEITASLISMLKTLVALSKSQPDTVADRVNGEITNEV